ncbi:hypothetical protein [Neorhodopirellula pilleata]|uniref:Uncharacterized protein n=1 Tax=Neorhodopirellula pilleata TaxID=2714738 RepID=A0A5C5ZLP2_9BACT|nr:hypothetical protein [Neorhodopirellula pilleata]TWT87996.1 hypothetical protein Pla100_57260 [Neorhodopirellula pilleata]
MIDALSWVIFAMLVIAGFQYVYESAVAPSIRIYLRYRVFSARDALRCQQFDSPVNEDAFEALQYHCNAMISCMSELHFSDLARVRTKMKDPEAQELVARMRKAIAECHDPAFTQIHKETCRISLAVLATNTGGLLIWIVPVVFAIGSLRRISRLAQAYLSLNNRENSSTRFHGRGLQAC